MLGETLRAAPGRVPASVDRRGVYLSTEEREDEGTSDRLEREHAGSCSGVRKEEQWTRRRHRRPPTQRTLRRTGIPIAQSTTRSATLRPKSQTSRDTASLTARWTGPSISQAK